MSILCELLHVATFFVPALVLHILDRLGVTPKARRVFVRWEGMLGVCLSHHAECVSALSRRLAVLTLSQRRKLAENCGHCWFF